MYPHLVRRYPRAHFTQALMRLCTRLDECWVKEFDFKTPEHSFELEQEGRVHIEITRLWAFGSWVQGLSTCGDLDLAAHLNVHWVGPAIISGQLMQAPAAPFNFEEARRRLFRVAPNVHVTDWNSITDDHEPKQVRASDCMLVWASPAEVDQIDWLKVLIHFQSWAISGRIHVEI